MKIKLAFWNLLTTFSSIYIPLLVFSVYEYSVLNRHARLIANIEEERISVEDIPQKIFAVEDGYSPPFFALNTIEIKKDLPIYPIGSLPYSKRYSCNEGYGLITFETDRFGLRNKDEKWSNLNQKNNIFLIGDSFTFGACVEDESTISNNLDKTLVLNSINLGQSGNSPYEYMATLKSIIEPLVQDLDREFKVVMIFYPNDNILEIRRREELLKFAKPIVEVSNNKEFFPNSFYKKNIVNLINENLSKSKLETINIIKTKPYKVYKRIATYQIGTLGPIRSRIKIFVSLINNKIRNKNFKNHSGLTVSQRSIKLLSEVCTDKCKPFTAFIPNSTYWRPDFRAELYKEELASTSQKFGIKFIDGESIIDKNDLKNYAPIGPHLSKEGYIKMSELISEKIQN